MEDSEISQNQQEVFQKYIEQIHSDISKSLFECKHPKAFAAAILYSGCRLAASCSIPKLEISNLFKDILEKYEDSLDEAEIVKNKLREALREAMLILGEREKDPEVQ